jgi:hypothetical protein
VSTSADCVSFTNNLRGRVESLFESAR